MDKEELKPCPFCGGKELVPCSDRLYCKQCMAKGPTIERKGVDQLMRNAWNRRTP